MRVALLVLFAVACFGCSTAPDGVPLAMRMFEVSKDVAAEDLEDTVLPQAARRKRKRWGNSALYIDGKFLGMLKFSELHPKVPLRFEEQSIDDETRYLRRFVWAELFEAHGVDVDDIRAVHFYGGRNFISVVDGDEFRRVGSSFRFGFTQGNKGKPRQRPPKEGIEYNVGIDIVRAVAVYVEREAPSYKQGKMTFSDGKVLATRDAKGRLVIPYSDGERHGGTRVYMDGKYIDAFRRRALTPDLLLDTKSPTSPYSLGKSLKKLGVSLSEVKRVELYDHYDKLVGSLETDALTKVDTVGFVLGQHSRGRIEVTKISKEKLGSVLLFAASEPPNRSVPKPSGSPPPQPKL